MGWVLEERVGGGRIGSWGATIGGRGDKEEENGIAGHNEEGWEGELETKTGHWGAGDGLGRLELENRERGEMDGIEDELGGGSIEEELICTGIEKEESDEGIEEEELDREDLQGKANSLKITWREA